MGTDLWIPVGGDTLTEVKMWEMPKRSELDNQKRTSQDRRTRQETSTVSILLEEESGSEKEKEDDVGDEDETEIWQVTDVTKEVLETTEGETVNLHDKLM